eukprot:15332883-Ditylum_brightwellii.AAC.1
MEPAPTENNPGPPDYVYSKETDHHPRRRKRQQKKNFLVWISGLLYALFYFITCKLAKACSDPGMKDFEALI